MNKRLIAGLLSFLPLLQATQSLKSGTGTASLPNGAPWNSLTTWRAEFRIHNWSFNGNYQNIIGTNSFAVRLGPDGAVLITSWQDGSQTCSVDPTPLPDVIVRLQRDGANSRLTAEEWSAVDGSGYTQTVCPLGQPGTPNDSGGTVGVGGLAGSLAYARIYSTAAALGAAPSNTYNGDLLDYELEGSGHDNSANGRTLGMTNPVYVNTPGYPPAVVFGQSGQQRTFRAGTGIGLDATASFSATDNAVLTHFWQQMSGPSIGKFSARGLPRSNFSAFRAGSYSIQDTVCDNLGNCGSAAHNYGAVATDFNGFIITGNPTTDFLLDPLTMSGTSPWPWYDAVEGADADVLATYQENPPPITPMSGTAEVTAPNNQYNPVEITGTGTHFTTETALGNVLFINWPTPDGLMGVAMGQVAAINSDTDLALDRKLLPFPIPLSGATLGTSTDSFDWGFWGLSFGRATDWNFYDDGLALYRHYYRTGRAEYLTQARALADNWYHYALDNGWELQYPRFTGLQGIIARALDGKPEYWSGILEYMNYPIGWESQFTQTTPLPAGSSIDPREYGYMLRWGALIARLHPDPAVRAQWCTNVANAVTNVWPSVQDSLGNFEEDVYNENAGYPYAPYNGLYGSSPWRTTIGLLGLHKAYEVLNDPAVCNLPAVAAATLPVIEGFTNFAHNYGKGGDRGQLYSVNYASIGQDPLGYAGFNGNTPNTVGTLAVTPGSATVTGTGTNFTTVFWHAPCTVAQAWCVGGQVQGQQPFYDGTYLTTPTNFIGIPSNCTRLTIQVISVESDTQLTVASPWPATCPAENNIGPNVNSVGWAATWEGNPNCGQYSLAAYCEGGPLGDRNLTHDIHEAYMWLFQVTGNQMYYNWAEDSLGADYGGSAGGPGSTLPVTGPLADGGTGFMEDPTYACSVVAPPCGGNGPTNNMGKAYGQSTGAGNAANAIARFLGTVQSLRSTTSYVGFDISAVGNAVSVQIEVTAPNGASGVFNCSSSPCAVTYDSRQGASQAVISYMSSQGKVLAQSSPFSVQ